MATVVRADHEPTDDSALVLWDCGSALYDSYELTAFKRQLDAAVLACRSISMPHLPATTAPATSTAGGRKKRARRLPALLRRLFSKVLVRLRLPASVRGARHHDRYEGYGHGEYYGATGSPWSGALTSIPEERDGSPETGLSPPVVAGPSALRRVQSERFIGSKTASPMAPFDVVL